MNRIGKLIYLNQYFNIVLFMLEWNETKREFNLLIKDENLTICMCCDGGNDIIILIAEYIDISLIKEKSLIVVSFISIILYISQRI